MPNLSDFGLKRKLTQREADLQVQHQDAQHQQALTQSQPIGFTPTPAVDPGNQYQNPGVMTPAAPPNPHASANNATAPRPAGVIQDTDPAVRAARLGLTPPPVATVPPGVQDPAVIAQVNAGNAAAAAAFEQQVNTKLEREQMKQGADQEAKGVTETPEAPSPSSGLLEQLKAQAIQNPGLADYIPILEGILSSQPAGQAATARDTALAGVDSTDLNNDGVSDGVAAAASESKKLLTGEKDEQDRINTENKNIATEAAEVSKEMAQIEKDKFELSQLRNENLLREQNIEAEIKNRRVAAKMGIDADTNGLKWMQEEIRKGNESLAFLTQAGDLHSSSLALQTGRQYALDVRTAINNYDSQQALIDSNYRKDIANVDNMVSLDAKERKAEKEKIWEKYWENKNKEDERTYNTLKEFGLKMVDIIQDQKNKELEGVIDEGDAQDFSLKMQDRVNGLDEVKSFTTINSQYQGMLSAKATYDSDPSTKPTFDTALVKLFEKILDPTSVVRQEEFESELRSQGLVRGAVQKAIDAFNGGQGLDAEMQAGMIKMSGSLYDAAKRTTVEAVQPTLAQLKRFNSRNGANVPLDEVLSPKVIDALDIPVNEFEEAEALLGGGEPQEQFSEEVGPQDFNSWLSTVGNGQTVSGSPYHGGTDQYALDIDGKIGDPIRPPVAGVVTAVNDKDKGGYGISYVMRDDQGYEHLFGHLNSVNVKVGQRVSPNMITGEMGNTGSVIPGTHGDGSHLHYRKTLDGQPVPVDQVAEQPSMTPTAQAADYPPPAPKPAPQPAKPLPQPVSQKVTANMGTAPQGLKVGSLNPTLDPKGIKTRFTYRTSAGGLVTVSSAERPKYDARPDLFTPVQ